MRGDERGFALPMTVLLIALITVMLTSGFARVRADRQVSESQEVSAEALSIARAGLSAFLDAQTTRPTDGMVDTMYVTGGYAITRASIVQNPLDTLASQTWIVRSTGYVIDPATGAVPRAQRTVAQFAEWQSAAIRVRAAWAAADGIERPSGGGSIPTSINGTAPAWCPGSSAGLRYASVTPATGKSFSVSPGAILESGIADSAKIDWQGVLNSGIEPDRTTPTIWPSLSFPTDITIVDGDFTTGPWWFQGIYGRGLLIVTGRLRIRSWIYWEGIILVGKDMDFEGSVWPSSSIFGMVVTGLNAQLPLPAGNMTGIASELGDLHPLQIQYVQCPIDQALEGLIGFAPIANAWVDNWATY